MLNLPESTFWTTASRPVHIDPDTYVEQIPNPKSGWWMQDYDNPDHFTNDPGFWEYSEEVRICEWCDEPFTASAHNHRFCSSACQVNAAGYAKTCETCGKSFASRFKPQRYCSQVCAGHAKRSSAYEIRCELCGEPARVTRKGQRFCSRECYNADRRSRKAAA